MLKAETPYPHVGSFALLIDRTLPESQQRAELARIMRRDELPNQAGDRLPVAQIAFPLRTGASGSCVVLESELIDGTPLSKAEERRLADLQREIAQRVKPKRTKVDEAEALRKRLIFSELLAAEKVKLERLQAKAQPSIGRALPRSEQGLAA